ncbi:MAG: hypothetical protein ACREM6_06300, partial [Vulcanimicrobiaceae bacterium]
ANAEPLKEIGHVRVTTPLCKALLVNASLAVRDAGLGDARIAAVDHDLRTTDYDSSELGRNRGVLELMKEESELHAAANAGRAEMKDFAALAKTAAPERQTAFVRLEQALDGALGRQQQWADTLTRLITYLQANPRIDQIQQMQNEDAAISNGEGPYLHGLHPPYGLPTPLTITAKTAADRLAPDTAKIAHDEDTASDRIDPAFSHC